MKIVGGYSCVLLMLTACAGSTSALKDECVQTLNSAASSSDFWVRVHAIEYLTALGYTEEARSHVASELTEFENVPEKRIGFWRCSYRLSPAEEKATWLDKIITAYTDTVGPDRVHAAETLSKLRVPLRDVNMELVTRDLDQGGTLGSYVGWGSALPTQGDEGRTAYRRLVDELGSADVARRKIAAYALGYLGDIPDDTWPVVAHAALKEPSESKAYPYMIGAAWSLYPDGRAEDDVLVDSLYRRLTSLKDFASKDASVQMCNALAARGQQHDCALLVPLMRGGAPLTQGANAQDDPSQVDVKAAAAFAILCIMNNESESNLKQ